MDRKRPLAVTIVGWVYIAVGVAGFAYHFDSLVPLQPDGLSIELTEFLAALGGAFLLRGRNWARWLALAWIAFHVILSVSHSPRELAIHSVICAAIAWFLFRPEAARYFRGASAEAA